MIGMVKLPPGRMGNQLLHYNFLRQVAAKAGVGYFHPAIKGLEFFESMAEKKRTLKRRVFNALFKRKISIDYNFVSKFTPGDFIEFVKAQSDKKCDIVLDKPLLAEQFFDYLFYDPNEFIKLRGELEIVMNIPYLDDTTRIGIHFRGTDFYSWDKNAVLDFAYYQEAILFCVDHFKNVKTEFLLISEDISNDVCKKILTLFKSLNIVPAWVSRKNSPGSFDLYRLSHCDVVISTPSTFALCAGFLIKRKKIIHSARWLNYAIDAEYGPGVFWRALIKSKSPYYALWKTF